MTEFLILLRSLNLYYHHLHNNCSGASFFSDHQQLASFYSQADDDYDRVIERSIGLTSEMRPDELVRVMREVTDILDNMPKLYDFVVLNEHLNYALQLEESLCQEVEVYLNSEESRVTEGTRQLLGDVADKSEVRQYLIGRRLK